MYAGRFITFEGVEGSGKSTQAALLVDRLCELGISVIGTREPGGSVMAEHVRSALLSGIANKSGGSRLELFLFSAARADHLDKLIRPALKQGCWVVCDRFIDSTRVYQSSVNPVELSILEKVVLGDVYPDFTIVLDLPVDVGLRRADMRRGFGTLDRFESEKIDFHDTRRRAFLNIAALESDRIAVVDSTLSVGCLSDEIWKVMRIRGIVE